MKYEVVVGIETHVQLATKSKLFCACNNDSREAEPNTHVCPVCLGFPGALPVLNEGAVKLALRAGYMLHAYDEVKQFHTKFDRKNYFYPDSPMNYQITQFDEPIIGKGYVEVPLGGEVKRIGVTRAHLEADAGKLVHPEGANYSLVDLNRAGTPLLEIVSEPDMRSAAEARAYAQELYYLMRFASVSDANLYYGNMRFDVNVSLRPAGEKEFGTRTESKNLNSFRAVQAVVEYETKRQTELLEKGETIVQETRGWDDAKQITFSQRSKEEAHDYRYFPEPDLPPLVITKQIIHEALELKTPKPSLKPIYEPMQIRKSLKEAGIAPEKWDALLDDTYAAGQWWLSIGHTEKAELDFMFNWLIGDKVRLAAETGISFEESELKPHRVLWVGEMVRAGKLSSTNAKALLEHLWVNDGLPDEEAQKLNLIQVSDTAALEAIVDEVITANPKPVEDYKGGETKALGFLVGQVMKASKGQANPPMVNDILKKKLGD